MAYRGGKRRRTSRRKRISRFTVMGILILALVLCGTMAYKYSVLKTQEKEYSRQIAGLKKEKKEAEKRAEEYVEEVAREKLGLVYKDEIIFEPDNDD